MARPKKFTHRANLWLTDEEVSRIDRWRGRPAIQIGTRNDAIRFLMTAALNMYDEIDFALDAPVKADQRRG